MQISIKIPPTKILIFHPETKEKFATVVVQNTKFLNYLKMERVHYVVLDSPN